MLNTPTERKNALLDIADLIVMERNKIFLLRFATCVCSLIAYLYVLFWYYTNNNVLLITSLATALACSALFIRSLLEQSSIADVHTLVWVCISNIYFTSITTWDLTASTAFYLLLLPVGSLYLLKTKDAFIHMFMVALLIITIPWASQYFNGWIVLSQSQLSYYSIIQALIISFSLFVGVSMIFRHFEELLHLILDKKAVLQRTQSDLIQTQRARNRFFASISHEIRTPMNSIYGITKLLHSKSTNLDQENRHMVGILKDNAEKFLSLINDILDLSKIEENKLKLVEADFELQKVIRETESMVKFAIQEKNLTLTVLMDPQLPILVRTDPNRLRQVILNLLNNAIKFTQKGSVTLICNHLADKKALLFVVEDTGIGIPADMQHKIFEGYVQTPDRISYEHGGTGLGLSICKGIVEQAGGTIWLQSAINEGSSFFFEWPIKAPKEPHLQTISTELSEVVAPDEALTVMIVEDHQANINIAKKLIQMYLPKTQFVIATSAEAALDYLDQKIIPHLILMDMYLPQLSGLECAQRIRKHQTPEIAKLPIIALTANCFPEDKQACYEAGMNDFITKPIEAEQLIEKIVFWYQRDNRNSDPVTTVTRNLPEEPMKTHDVYQMEAYTCERRQEENF